MNLSTVRFDRILSIPHAGAVGDRPERSQAQSQQKFTSWECHMHPLFKAGLGLVAWLIVGLTGCKSTESYTSLPEQPSGFFATPGDGSVVDLARRQPSTRPVEPPREPVMIEQGDRATLIYTCRNTPSEVLASAIDGLVSPEGSIEASSVLKAVDAAPRRSLLPSVGTARRTDAGRRRQ